MRARERGTAAVLLAFAVLAFASAAVLLLQRSVVREWALEGEELLGTRAALTAESALAWFLEDGWKDLAPGSGDGELRVPEAVLPAEPGLGHEAELRTRCLGPGPQGAAWKVTARGRVRVLGTGRPAFLQVREAYVLVPPGGPPVLRAWRIVR